MTTANEVLDFVKNLVDELKDYEDEITFDTTLAQLDLDSLDYVQTQIEVKKLFGVSLNTDLFISGKITTVGHLCQYVANPIMETETQPAAVQ
jgi:acyl carrier protein